MKRNRPIYDEIQFDSPDEVEFYAWCKQLLNLGVLKEFQYQPQSFILSQKVPFAKKSWIRQHVYTTDFKLTFSQNAFELYPQFKQIFKYQIDNNQCYVQIKPGFDRFGDFKAFGINQKWTYSKFGIYVYKIQVQSLFLKTFVPEYSRYTEKTRKLRDKYKHTPNVKQYLHT